MDSDDGFMTVPRGRTTARLTNEVSFTQQNAMFPRDVMMLQPARVTWQWNSNGLVRARFSDDGALAVKSAVSDPELPRYAPTGGLYAFIGRKLRGRYPIARVDGRDVYIDVSGEGVR